MKELFEFLSGFTMKGAISGILTSLLVLAISIIILTPWFTGIWLSIYPWVQSYVEWVLKIFNK